MPEKNADKASIIAPMPNKNEVDFPENNDQEKRGENNDKDNGKKEGTSFPVKQLLIGIALFVIGLGIGGASFFIYNSMEDSQEVEIQPTPEFGEATQINGSSNSTHNS